MRDKLINSIAARIEDEITPRLNVRFIKELEPGDLVDKMVTVLYMFSRGTKRGSNPVHIMSELCCSVGRDIRGTLRLPPDSAKAARAGAFILKSFEILGLVDVKKGRANNDHATYLVEVVDHDAIQELWSLVEVGKTEKLPSTTPYEPWVSLKHPCGANMIKSEAIAKNGLGLELRKTVKTNKTVTKKSKCKETGKMVEKTIAIPEFNEVVDRFIEVTPDTHPIVYESINRSQRVGWNVNTEVLEILKWAFKNKTDAFADVWELQDRESKNGKIREIKAVIDTANRFSHDTFYHLYYYDFRCRKYPATAYFHEQGSDCAKGCLLRQDKKAIGEQGFFWLMISIASNWAGDAGRDDGYKTDKIPLNDRVEWALDNEEILLSYAESPKVNQGWMKADKPWQFLAACIELRKFREWQIEEELRCRIMGDDFDEYAYESHLEAFIDGSNNGSQHLAALTRDEETAKHVNLVPQDLPGDLYAYVAEGAWELIMEEFARLTPAEIAQCEEVIAGLDKHKDELAAAQGDKEKTKAAYEKMVRYRKENEDIVVKASPVYWAKITSLKERRKIVKRNVMTLPYGGTAYGLGQQQISDARKHGISALMKMEHKWASYMGRLVFNACGVKMAKLMRLLAIFEGAGKGAETRNEYLNWRVPVTGFPVIQYYVEGTVKKVWIQYGKPEGERLKTTRHWKNTYQLNICFNELRKPSRRKQVQGASPNIIHSLDAAHLNMVVTSADFVVTTIHDSFGALLGDMPDLFVIAREQFVELYKNNPIHGIMEDIQGDYESLTYGSLDVEDILDSEYAFV